MPTVGSPRGTAPGGCRFDPGRTLPWIAEMRTHRIAMHPMTRCVERDWMNIHPPLAARHNLYAQRAPVRLYAVAETTQGRHTRPGCSRLRPSPSPYGIGLWPRPARRRPTLLPPSDAQPRCLTRQEPRQRGQRARVRVSWTSVAQALAKPPFPGGWRWPQWAPRGPRPAPVSDGWPACRLSKVSNWVARR